MKIRDELALFLTGLSWTLLIIPAFPLPAAADSGLVFVPVNLAQIVGGEVRSGDIDGDGYPDLLVSGCSRGNGCFPLVTKILRNQGNQGNSTFFVDSGAVLPGLRWASADWGDFDNDGDLDLVIAGNNGSVDLTKIYRNDNGTFVDTNIDLPRSSLGTVQWGDYNNDGKLDLLINGSSGTYVVRNDGNGVFTVAASNLLYFRPSAAAWIDIDNDKNLDIILVGKYDSALFYNVGGDGFNRLETPIVRLDYASITVADYDGDNLQDFLITGLPFTNLIYHNDGNRRFSSASIGNNAPLLAAQSGTQFVDLNGDGLLDILISGFDEHYRRETRVYRQDPIHSFSGGGATWLAGVSGAVVALDYDRDYNVDVLLMGTDGPTSIMANLYRNTATHKLTGTIKINGEPLSGASVIISGSIFNATTTMSDGTFTYSGIASGNVIVEPVLPGYDFMPARRNVSVRGRSLGALDFEASLKSVSTTTTTTTATTPSHIPRPKVKALKSIGRAGRIVSLRYKLQDSSQGSREIIRVFNRKKPISEFQTSFLPRWHLPSQWAKRKARWDSKGNEPGNHYQYQFCLRAVNSFGRPGARSCAKLKLY